LRRRRSALLQPGLEAIDTVAPLISLDQRSTWYPDPHVSGGGLVLWWLNLATLVGWLLSSISVLSPAAAARLYVPGCRSPSRYLSASSSPSSNSMGCR